MIEDTTQEEDDDIEEDNIDKRYTEKEKVSIDEELPSKCPVCKKRQNNILLHIRLKESCNKEIIPDLYKRWKNLANKRNRIKAQKRYIETGKHKNVMQLTKSTVFKFKGESRRGSFKRKRSKEGSKALVKD